uniref:DNA2/NAM7 helicase-like C-terminal domain-containing protein n=1 Tax=Chromera velia CCMP2878 TaxID=1169474 RepID=A0A0G4HTL5_9ALVE|eukprot:Cvel_8440.t1-p1 / transcript=Cvel_8440.t1 / gene=Cvel_8440 / organism=Chromera_velia_CCMP2878 / gene_product=NFX1-type zinc finger-containing protein 1, putative / transcript_product=NFX1-type zinc finger-containing protein 1, putative / location=Cvel_scaffold466:21075-24983(-) / protein_length=1066 / sequence_SO=supercontig / SO=protein_coding / is_pseudo=false
MQGAMTDYRTMPFTPTSTEMANSARAATYEESDHLPVHTATYESGFAYLDSMTRLQRHESLEKLLTCVSEWKKGTLDERDMTIFDASVVGFLPLLHKEDKTLRSGEVKRNVRKIPGFGDSETPVQLMLKISARGTRDKGRGRALWKRDLMFGNLVGVFLEGVQGGEPIWATIGGRSDELLDREILFVDLLSSSLLPILLQRLCLEESGTLRGTLIVSPTFYRAHQPVLNALQNLDPDALPFEKELLSYQSPQQSSPLWREILSHADSADFSPFFQEHNEPVILSELFTSHTESLCDGRLQEEDLGSDPEDLFGYRRSFEPRVGGESRTVFGEAGQMPLRILTVAYKNDATDDLLQKVLRECPRLSDRVARIGRKSEIEEVEKCNLQQIKAELRGTGFFMQSEGKREIESRAFDLMSSLKTRVRRMRESIDDHALFLVWLQRADLQSITDFLSHSPLFSRACPPRQRAKRAHNLAHLLESVRFFDREKSRCRRQHSGGLLQSLGGVFSDMVPDSEEPQDERLGSFLADLATAGDRDPLNFFGSQNSMKKLSQDPIFLDLISSLHHNFVVWLPSPNDVASLAAATQHATNTSGSTRPLAATQLDSLLEELTAARRQKESSGQKEGDGDEDEEEVRDLMLERLDLMGADRRSAVHLVDQNIYCTQRSGGERGLFSYALYSRLSSVRDVEGGLEAMIYKEGKGLWGLPPESRVLFVQSLFRGVLGRDVPELDCCLRELSDLWRRMKAMERREDISLLRHHIRVLGMTITGASSSRELIRAWAPDIIILEEAGEVLEPHVLALLAPTVRQVVLVGDHQQLPPPLESMLLKTEKKFGVSLMERLIKGGYGYAKLRVQSRMAPRISQHLLDIYPDLENNIEVVGALTDTQALVAPIFFWDTKGKFPETTGERGFSNLKEAECTVRLVSFLIREGEDPSDVVVLAPYKGQVATLRRLVGKNPDLLGVRVSPVDRFQGSEAGVVVVSLTRSNAERNVGFLDLGAEGLARRNVLQSRSRRVTVLIGDRQTFAYARKRSADQGAQPSRVWGPLFRSLEKSDALGAELEIKCPRHPHL